VTKAQLFPTVLMSLDVLAAVFYATECDFRRMVYWIAAAVLTATVTY